MKFVYRKPYDDDHAEYLKGEKAYEDHLLARKPKLDRGDLWRFFGWDFFHDGLIESISMPKEYRGLEIRINGPNIEVHGAGDEFRFINVGFTLRFQCVDFFQINTDEADRTDLITYLDAEVDTLADLMAAARKRWYEQNPDYESDKLPEFHSLLIMTLQSLSIAIVFQSLSVDPDEPMAFEMMLRDPNFKVPIRDDPNYGAPSKKKPG